MRVLLNLTGFSRFKGIAPEFTNKKGYRITPVSTVPNQEMMDNAVAVTKKETPKAGMNGEAFMWGQDLVVKKYKHKDDACNFNPRREIEALDLMYDDKIVIPGSQKGVYAFETPDGETYLVSTQVRGETLGNKTSLTHKELSAIMKVMEDLDKGVIKNGFLKRPMHFDLSQENLKTDGIRAGVFDFEYLQYDDTALHLAQDSTDLKEWIMCPHLSDVKLLPSNLRTLEHRALYSILCSSDSPEEFFEDYLQMKGKYYTNLAEYHKGLIGQTGTYGLHKLSREEEVYGEFLKKNFADKDVKKAEAMKIQAARFIFDFNNVFKKTNSGEFEEYIIKAENFFSQKMQEAKEKGDMQRVKYFSDGMELFRIWEKAGNFLDFLGLKTDEKFGNFITLDSIVV